MSGQKSYGAWRAFYSPRKESTRWGVRDPNMSGLRAGHVWQPFLKPDLGTEHVWCRGLTWVKPESRTCPVQEPDMSKTCLWNSVAQPNKSCWDLVTEMVELGRTCPVQEPNMSSKSYWNPAWNPGKPS
jgi:hypothetical protein